MSAMPCWRRAPALGMSLEFSVLSFKTHFEYLSLFSRKRNTTMWSMATICLLSRDTSPGETFINGVINLQDTGCINCN